MRDTNDERLSSEEAVHPWIALVGPFYEADGLSRWLNVTNDELDRLVADHIVLGLMTQEGETRYPSFQFDDNGTPLPHLAEFIERRTKREGRENLWGFAIWLNTPIDEWDGRTAAHLLRTPHAEEVLLQTSEEYRRPLGARADNEARMAIARPILNRIIELTVDLAIVISPGTLYVTSLTPPPQGVFAVTTSGDSSNLIVGRFPIAGDREEIAQHAAEYLERRTLPPDPETN
jgi:hypothetical protein